MNPHHWGIDSPFNTEMSTGLNKEIMQEHANDDVIAAANREQRRRFQRIEAIKTVGALVGGVLLLALALTILGLFIH